MNWGWGEKAVGSSPIQKVVIYLIKYGTYWPHIVLFPGDLQCVCGLRCGLAFTFETRNACESRIFHVITTIKQRTYITLSAYRGELNLIQISTVIIWQRWHRDLFPQRSKKRIPGRRLLQVKKEHDFQSINLKISGHRWKPIFVICKRIVSWIEFLSNVPINVHLQCNNNKR